MLTSAPTSSSVRRQPAFLSFCGAAILATIVPAPPVRGQAPSVRVVLATAEQREVVQTVLLVGTVEPLRRSTIGAEIAGLVRDMPVREGDFVTKGQLLCQLKDETIRHQHAEESARLGTLRERLAELEAGTRQEDLDRLKAAVEEAAALKQKWEFEKHRLDDLMEKGSASTKEYQDTVSEYHAAVKRLVQAEALYRLAVAGPRKEVIAQARHAVAAQEAVVARVAEELAKTRITAPFAGFVADRFAEVGQWLQAGGDVVELVDISAVLVRVQVPEHAVAFNLVGDAAQVQIDALDRRFEGRIEHVIPQAAIDARTFPVEIRIDNPEHLIKSGMFVRATVAAGTAAAAVVVPLDAVVHRKGLDYVALVRPGQQGAKMAVPMPVTIGAQDEGWVAVTSGNVAPGMQVVVRGNENILFPTPIEPVTMEAFEATVLAAPASGQETESDWK